MLNGIQRLLIFSIRGDRYAVDLQDVSEVMVPQEMYHVPWAPPCIKGAINFHGSLVSVLDLACVMNVGAMGREGSILVLDKRIANLALWVENVENIVLSDGILEQDESSNPLLRCMLIMADGEVGMLALDKLLAQIEETLRR